MILSVENEVTIVEAGVVVVGVAITWAVYRRGRVGTQPSPQAETTAGTSDPGPVSEPRRGPNG